MLLNPALFRYEHQKIRLLRKVGGECISMNVQLFIPQNKDENISNIRHQLSKDIIPVLRQAEDCISINVQLFIL